MSFAPTLPAPDRTERLPAALGDAGFDTDRLICPPPSFATPTRSAAPRSVVQFAGLSLTKVLRRLFRKADSQPAAPLPVLRDAPAASRKRFCDSRPNLYDDLMRLDELDPLPFVADDELRPFRTNLSDNEQSRDPRDGALAGCNRCIAVARLDENEGASVGLGSTRTASCASFECDLLEVNMSGIAIHAPQFFPRGSMLSIRIHAQASDRFVNTSGTVVRCEALQRGGFQVVCRLEKYLHFAEIREIGHDLFASAIV